MGTTSREPLRDVLIRASELSTGSERTLARLPGFRVPGSFRLRRGGQRVLDRWGVEASAHILLAARWRQAAFILAVLSAGALASGTLPLQVVGGLLDFVALGCVLQGNRRRSTSGIPVSSRSKVSEGNVRA